MVIFNQEKEDGISIEMLCKGSITYASCIEPVDIKSIKSPALKKSVAAYSDTDLYYVQSILVSSNWNKNDDIFDKAEVWMAKNTPEDKPTNLEHDENTIIGHIVSNWPIDENGEIIPEDIKIKDLPDKFHIMTASVIYRGFTDPILRDRSDQLIKEIENGTKYVSMECFFNNFDYGLINQSTGEYKILNRNEETSYLTKYLRAYGGKGEFENYKIGRVLRRITFSGKGFVDKPANADSIIFTKNNIMSQKKLEIQKIGVFDNQTDSHQTENDIMAENTTATENTVDLEAANAELVVKVQDLEKQVQELTTANESAIQQHTQATEEAAKACEANILAVKQEMDNMKQELSASYEENMQNMQKDKEELMAMYDKKIAEMNEEMQKDKELLASYRNKEEERMMAEMYKKRMASLVSAGLSSEDADATAKQFESFTDEQFDSIVATLNKVSTQNPESTQQVEATDNTVEANESGAEETSEEATDSDDETSEAAEASAILDEVEVAEEVSLAVGGEEESEAHNTRAALIDFVYSRLGKK